MSFGRTTEASRTATASAAKGVVVDLQKQIAQAPDAKVVQQFQRELKAVQAQLVVEKSNPPENVPGLLQSLNRNCFAKGGVIKSRCYAYTETKNTTKT